MKKIFLFVLLAVACIWANEKLAVLNVASIGSAGKNLKEQAGNNYFPKNLIDGDLKTAWALPYESGDVILQFQLKKKASILNKMKIYNGYIKSEQRFQENSRAKRISIYINGIKKENLYGSVTLDDSMLPQEIDFGNKENVRVIYIRIRSVYPGKKWKDLCISEISFEGTTSNETTDNSDYEAIAQEYNNYTVTVPAQKLALNEQQIGQLSRSRYFVLTPAQKQALSEVWDVDTLSLIPSNWYDCSCGMYTIQWSNIDTVFIPTAIMPSQAISMDMDIDYGPFGAYKLGTDGKLHDVGRVIMGLDGQLYQKGKLISIESLLEQQRKINKIIDYTADGNCAFEALSIDFPPQNIMDDEIIEHYKKILVKRGLKFCEMNTSIDQIRMLGDND